VYPSLPLPVAKERRKKKRRGYNDGGAGLAFHSPRHGKRLNGFSDIAPPIRGNEKKRRGESPRPPSARFNFSLSLRTLACWRGGLSRKEVLSQRRLDTTVR